MTGDTYIWLACHLFAVFVVFVNTQFWLCRPYILASTAVSSGLICICQHTPTSHFMMARRLFKQLHTWRQNSASDSALDRDALRVYVKHSHQVFTSGMKHACLMATMTYRRMIMTSNWCACMMPSFWNHPHYLVLLLADTLLCNIVCSSDSMDLELFLHVLGRRQLRGLKSCKLWHEQDTTVAESGVQFLMVWRLIFICQSGMHNNVPGHSDANVCKQTHDASCMNNSIMQQLTP